MHILLVEDGKLNITDAAPDLSSHALGPGTKSRGPFCRRWRGRKL